MVDKPKTVYDHYWCTRLGVEWSLCKSEVVDCKGGGGKDALIGGM